MGKENYNSYRRSNKFLVGEPGVSWNGLEDVPVEVQNITTELSAKEDTGVAATQVASHAAAVDPHPQYLTPAEGTAAYAAIGHTHSAATTSVSGFLSASDKTKLDGIATGATANSADAFLLGRANHTGTQTAATISDFNTAADARIAAAIGTTVLAFSHAGTGGTAHAAVTTSVNGFMSAADKTKLDSIATGATVNASDASLRDRSTHTGTQLSTTISDFVEASQDVIGAMVAAAGGSYNDAANTITLPSGGAGLAGLATVTVPANALEHSQTAAATGVTSSKIIICSIANHTDTDENSAELLDIGAISALPGTDLITFNLSFATPTQGDVKLNWSAI